MSHKVFCVFSVYTFPGKMRETVREMKIDRQRNTERKREREDEYLK